MISEPELVGGPDEGPPPGTMLPDGGPSRVDRSRTGAREWRRQPWLWALGGAVAASALWAAGLYAYGGQGPEQHGYRLERRSCEKVRLPAMSARLGRVDTAAGYSNAFHDLALDRLDCSVQLRSQVTDGKRRSYLVHFSVEQHRLTDPGPEFEARLRLDHGGVEGDAQTGLAGRLSPVPGLGDKAYFFALDYGGESMTLAVQHGGAVLLLETALNRADEGDETGAVDLTPLKPLMEADMRAAMEALRG
ncbi:hypothetical protein ACIQM4_06945 [Streptomyces sp. NPDC091272]|uniref:hypothetical protein n=1 Tax=Streptomyces sp. NPDC091272 TaxID=3365981 RepID=UPI00381A2E66